MTAAKDFQTAGRWAREIVAKRVLLTQIIGQGLGLLVLAHVLNVQQSETVTNAVAGGISALAAIVGVLWSRDATTPADPALAPTTVSGVPLVPVSAVPTPPAPPAAV